jgi:hypothetical protein
MMLSKPIAWLAFKDVVFSGGKSSRITLNNRLATAAAAIVQRMMMRRRPRRFRLVSPLSKGSIALVAIASEKVQRAVWVANESRQDPVDGPFTTFPAEASEGHVPAKLPRA